MSLEDDLCDAEDRCDELETELAACRAVIKDLKEGTGSYEGFMSVIRSWARHGERDFTAEEKEELRRAYRSWCKERGHAL